MIDTKVLRLRMAAWSALALAGVSCGATLAAQESPLLELAAQVESRLVAVGADETLDANARERALARLDEARRELEQSRADGQLADSLAADRLAAPTLIAEAQAFAPEPPGPPVPERSAADLELLVVEADARASASQTRLAELRSALAEQRELRVQVPTQLATARDRLSSARADLAQARAAGPDSAGEAATDSQILAEARETALLARIALLEERRTGLDVREQLLVARIAAAERELEAREVQLSELRQLLEQQRRAEAAALGSSVSPALVARHPVLQEVAAANRALLAREAEAEGARARLQQARKAIARLDSVLATTERDFDEVRGRLDALGHTIAAGALVNNVLGEIAEARTHRMQLVAREDLINAAQLDLVALSRERKILEGDLPEEVERRLERAAVSAGEDRPLLREALVSLLQARLSLLTSAIRDVEEYVGLLTGLQARQQGMVVLLDEYDEYLRSRQLWLPNVRPVDARDVKGALAGTVSVFSPVVWRGSVDALAGHAARQPASFLWRLLWLVVAVAAIKALHWARRRGREPAGTAASLATAFARALGLATAWAVGAWALGSILTVPDGSPTALAALGSALTTLTQPIFIVVALLELFRQAGPLERTGGMSPALGAAIRRAARWYALVLPLLALTQLAFAGYLAGDLPLGDLAARLCLAVIMVIAAVIADGLLRPRRGRSAAVSLLPGNVRAQSLWRWAVYGVAMLLPAILLALVMRGYLQASYWLFSMLAATGAVLAVYTAARAAMSIATMPGTPAPHDTTDEAARLRARRDRFVQLLLTVGTIALLLWIWRDALVAVSYLQSIVLWTTTGPDGEQSVTLANLLYFAAALAFTTVLVWALPVLFGTRSMDTSARGVGARYAMASLTKYAVGIVGVLVAFSLLNVGWSKLQWMAAGLSVGLGFGLQETVSNFVAGLILLSERPIRVGDRVSVGQATGVVTRIQIRATTIRDYDGRELIIPNKVLVTSEVSNWTLSNTDRRLQLAVGVAYGSDTALVERMLLEAAASLEWVLAEPPPRVVFEQFGDNALQFRLYVWIDGSDHALDSIHRLHMTVDRSFREHRIEISFPQRDVHLDASRPLEVQLVAPRQEVP